MSKQNKHTKNNKNKSKNNTILNKNGNNNELELTNTNENTNNTVTDTSVQSSDINDNDTNIDTEITSTHDTEFNDNKPHMSDFMGNTNEIFSTYKNKYENTMSSAVILLFFGVFGIISTIGMLVGYINFTLSTFQHVFLTTLYLIFLVYGVISYFKALDYKEHISTENTMEDTINRYLENHVTKEFLESLYDNSITDEENYVLYINKIQALFLEENPDFNKDLVEYHIDNFLNENF